MDSQGKIRPKNASGNARARQKRDGLSRACGSNTVVTMETDPFRAHREKPVDAPKPAPDSRAGGAGGPHEWVAERVSGHAWYYRAPLLLILAWILKNHFADPMYSSIFDGVNLGFHEAGHAAFMWFGSRFWSIAGGTIFELGVPVAAGLYLLYKQHDPFGASVCLFWLGTAFVGAGIYAADALVQELPLVSPFGPVDAGSHDWTSMLMKFGTLSRAEEIGGSMQSAGKITMATSLFVGSWVLWVTAKTTSAAGPEGTRGLPQRASPKE